MTGATPMITAHSTIHAWAWTAASMAAVVMDDVHATRDTRDLTALRQLQTAAQTAVATVTAAGEHAFVNQLSVVMTVHRQ